MKNLVDTTEEGGRNEIKQGLEEHYDAARFTQDWARLNNKIDPLRLEARGVISGFVKEQIKHDNLRFTFGDHGHLGYTDEKFRGHYVFPSVEGVCVTVYLHRNMEGDFMDASGTRGDSMSIYVDLTSEERARFAKLISQDIKDLESDKDYKDSFGIVNRLKDSLKQLEDRT